MQKGTEEKTIQTLAAVASLSGLSLKKATTGDDLKEFTLTLAFVGVSAGLVQERFDFERVDTRHTINGRGEVEHIDGLQPGDLAETGEEADKEINGRAAAALTGEMDGRAPVQSIATEVQRGNIAGEHTTITKFEPSDPDDEGKPDIHLVGEAAALGKKRR